MKSIGHIYMANIIREEILKSDGYVKLDVNGNIENYEVPQDVYEALLHFPEEFRGGAVGPDFFPDMITGQMVIHPTYSGEWLNIMMEELQKIPRNEENHNLCPYRRALAFYVGVMMHYSGDMFTHIYVNKYALGWFPSIGGILSNFASLEVDNILEAIKDLMIIFRHMLVEIYLDQQIEEHAIAKIQDDYKNQYPDRPMVSEEDAQKAFRHNLAVKVPVEYLKSCFANKKALERSMAVRKQIALDSDQSYEECFTFDFLQAFVTYVEEYRDEINAKGTTLLRVSNMRDREKNVEEWIGVWEHVANEMHAVGLGDSWDEYSGKLLRLALDGYLGKDKDGLRNFLQGVIDALDVLGSISIYIPFLTLLKLWLKESVKATAFKVIQSEAESMYQEITGEQVTFSNFDDMIDHYKELLEHPEIVLSSQVFMHRKDVDKKLLEDWGTIGYNNDTSQQPFKEFQRAINYAKLVLMGTDNLNNLIEEKHFHEQKQEIGIRRVRVTIHTSTKRFSGTDADVFFGIKLKNTLESPFITVLDKDGYNDFEMGDKDNYDLLLNDTYRLSDIESFWFELRGKDMWRTSFIDIRDLDTGISLARIESTLTFKDKTRYYISCFDKLENKYKDINCNQSLYELLVEVKTANVKYAGTDGTVKFGIEFDDGSTDWYELDKSGYNDFEKGDLDTYAVILKKPIDDLNKVRCFKLYNSEKINKGWTVEYCVVYDRTTGKRLASKTLNANLSGTSIDFPVQDMRKEEHMAHLDGTTVDVVNWMIDKIIVTIKTANVLFAGTDGDIYFKVNYMKDGALESYEEQLDDQSNNFERNNLETFSITLPEQIHIGDLVDFRVRKSNGDDWECQYVTVHDSATNRRLGHTECCMVLASNSNFIQVPVDEYI